MFYLYRSRDLTRYLSPGDFQYILTPAQSLKEACIHYDLSSNTNGWSLQFGVPPRKSCVSSYAQPYRHNSRSYADPIYDEVERELQIGWLVGVEHGKCWNGFRNPFHIDDDGELVFSPTPSSWHSWFEDEIKSAYRNAIADHHGQKPAPTQRVHHDYYEPAPAGRTLNSANVGRLLAAGGVYNGNIEGFRQTAEQLGGDAVKGYDDVLNQTTSGMMVAAASLLITRNPMAAEELTSYLGKYKKAHVLLDDMNVSELNYVRRNRAEYAVLRGEFNSTVRPNFLKSLSAHPDAVSTFDSSDLLRLADGKVPSGWQVHHKIPLDDSGTNAVDNLILMQKSPYHSSLSKTQAIITKELPYNASTNVLWPSPNGVIYPVGK
ncbi:HNH endonuclease signature motif containing protein [Enterobacter chuandaensis]|uniref:HNH endonuclease signature motif containing protein n=1 Tax=Enterobacter chuandaensis TaxID=2497875 RepID=A0AA96M1U2_9ENTR|nr:HNH endonuclease signature motif containing protein [Enterobacter chuandaensis]WNS35895.1 HNH endonuclease signature motif containing protein [Enterobacter chuandaensis]